MCWCSLTFFLTHLLIIHKNYVYEFQIVSITVFGAKYEIGFAVILPFIPHNFFADFFFTIKTFVQKMCKNFKRKIPTAEQNCLTEFRFTCKDCSTFTGT